MELLRNKSTNLEKNNTKSTFLQLNIKGKTVEERVIHPSTGGTSSIDGNLKKMKQGLDYDRQTGFQNSNTKQRPDQGEDARINLTTNQINVEKVARNSQKGSRNTSNKRRDSLIKKANGLFRSPLLPKIEMREPSRGGDSLEVPRVLTPKRRRDSSNQVKDSKLGPGIVLSKQYKPLNTILKNINLQGSLPSRQARSRTSARRATSTPSPPATTKPVLSAEKGSLKNL